jgi:hypothetical protein
MAIAFQLWFGIYVTYLWYSYVRDNENTRLNDVVDSNTKDHFRYVYKLMHLILALSILDVVGIILYAIKTLVLTKPSVNKEKRFLDGVLSVFSCISLMLLGMSYVRIQDILRFVMSRGLDMDVIKAGQKGNLKMLKEVAKAEASMGMYFNFVNLGLQQLLNRQKVQFKQPSNKWYLYHVALVSI